MTQADEIQDLREQLRKCDVGRRRAQTHVTELQNRLVQAARELRRRETEWMAKYDHSVQELLKIVKYHEEEKERLRAEVKQLQEAVKSSVLLTKNTRSTQTETKTNCVRFRDDWDNIRTVDAKTVANLARMERLFEQLQASKIQRLEQVRPFIKKKIVPNAQDSSCTFKTVVSARLNGQVAELRRRSDRTTIANSEKAVQFQANCPGDT